MASKAPKVQPFPPTLGNFSHHHVEQIARYSLFVIIVDICYDGYLLMLVISLSWIVFQDVVSGLPHQFIF